MLILVKIRNAAELLWDSLDTQERVIVAYIVGSLAVSLLAAHQRKARAQLKEELIAEVEARRGR